MHGTSTGSACTASVGEMILRRGHHVTSAEAPLIIFIQSYDTGAQISFHPERNPKFFRALAVYR